MTTAVEGWTTLPWLYAYLYYDTGNCETMCNATRASPAPGMT